MTDDTELWTICDLARAEVVALLTGIDWASARDTAAIKGSLGDLVTKLDEQVEDALADRLPHLVAGSRVAGEEHGGDIGVGPTWIVDPIDGTTNVVHGVRHASTTVALWIDGTVRAGLVHDLFRGDTWMAVLGGGARWVTADGVSHDLAVSPAASLSESLVSFGLPYDRRDTERTFAAARRVFDHCQDLRRTGSAALDLVSIAKGEYDAHFELDVRVWDVAGAALVLTETGGRVSGWHGEELVWSTLGQKVEIVASNGMLHDELLAVIAGSNGG